MIDMISKYSLFVLINYSTNRTTCLASVPGIVNMLVRNPEEEKREKEKTRRPFKVSRAEWYDDFLRNRRIIQTSLHILHPAIRLIASTSSVRR